tara:strand:+ start:91 stop:570 length:480 start_codon:yes stop_codon:yes gene_type:complete
MANTTRYNFNKPTVGADANAWGTKLNDNWDNIDDLLNGQLVNSNNAKLKNLKVLGKVTEEIENKSGVSGNVTLDVADGTIQTMSISGNVTQLTITMDNGEFMKLKIESVGTNTIAWPSGMYWVFGAEPSLHATNANWVQVWKQGGDLYGSYVGFTADAP